MQQFYQYFTIYKVKSIFTIIYDTHSFLVNEIKRENVFFIKSMLKTGVFFNYQEFIMYQFKKNNYEFFQFQKSCTYITSGMQRRYVSNLNFALHF